jgi:hypothetical protein
VYRGETHSGEHAPIIDRPTFEAVQAKLAENARTRRVQVRVLPANPVSWCQGNSLYLSGALARETPEIPVSVARNRWSALKIPTPSLASANLFMAEIGGFHRDRFDCRQRRVRVRRPPSSRRCAARYQHSAGELEQPPLTCARLIAFGKSVDPSGWEGEQRWQSKR